MQFKIDFQAMMSVLSDAMIGWAGVFAVTAVIIVAIWVLNKATEKRG